MRLCASVRQLQLSGGRPASKRERPICAAEQEGYAAIPRDDMSRGKEENKKLEPWGLLCSPSSTGLSERCT